MFIFLSSIRGNLYQGNHESFFLFLNCSKWGHVVTLNKSMRLINIPLMQKVKTTLWATASRDIWVILVFGHKYLNKMFGK